MVDTWNADWLNITPYRSTYPPRRKVQSYLLHTGLRLIQFLLLNRMFLLQKIHSEKEGGSGSSGICVTSCQLESSSGGLTTGRRAVSCMSYFQDNLEIWLNWSKFVSTIVASLIKAIENSWFWTPPSPSSPLADLPGPWQRARQSLWAPDGDGRVLCSHWAGTSVAPAGERRRRPLKGQQKGYQRSMPSGSMFFMILHVLSVVGIEVGRCWGH